METIKKNKNMETMKQVYYKNLSEFDWNLIPIRKGHNYYQYRDMCEVDVYVYTKDFNSYKLKKSVNVLSSDCCREEQESYGSVEYQLNELGIKKEDIIEIAVEENYFGYSPDGDKWDKTYKTFYQKN